MPLHGCNVHDGALASFFHFRHAVPGKEKDAGDIHSKALVPRSEVCFRYRSVRIDSRCIHKHIHAAEQLHCCLHGGFYIVGRCDVALADC